MPNFLSQIKANQIPIAGLVPETVATLPASPANGQMVYHTADNKVKAFQNGVWATLDSTPVTSVAGKTGAVTLVKGDVGLGNVDNTSDANKPVSTAQQTALDLKAPLASPALTGTPTAPTASQGTSTTQIATTSFVTTGLNLKANLASPALTGTPTAPTAVPGTNSTQLATTAFVASATSGLLKWNNSAATGELVVGAVGSTDLDDASSYPDISAGGARINNVGTPVQANDAATKSYVDTAIQGLSPKEAVRVRSGIGITLSGLQTIDGVSVQAGDRVLAGNQTNGYENGIYIASAGAWTRATDADSEADLLGAFTFVMEGTSYANTMWMQLTDAPITVGTTVLSWGQFSAASDITASGGLWRVGNAIQIASSGVTTIKVQDGAITNPKIDDLAVDGNKLAVGAVQLGSAKVTGTLAVAKGGTGGTDAYQARFNLGATGATNGLIPALTAGVWTTIVNLGVAGEYSGTLVEFHDDTTKERLSLDYRTNGSPADLQVRSDVAVAANTIRYALVARGI